MKEKKTYYIRNEHYSYKDFTKYESSAWDEEDVALQLAEEYYDSDPGDANEFKFVIDVKTEEQGVVSTFVVTAEYSVDFYARKTALKYT